MTINKYIGYVRVSTVGQAEDGQGLEIQEAAILERIGGKGGWGEPGTHKEFRLHRDEGVSGALIDRPGLSGALRSLEKDDVIVVAKLDRLARDLISQELLLREIRSKGARLWSCAEGEQAYISDDADDPSRKFIRQILGATAEYEKALITLRLRGGRKARRDKGEFAGGEAPFGFRASDRAGQLEPDPREQKVLEQIREFRSEGLNYTEIARRLDNMRGMHRRRGRDGGKGKWDRTAITKLSKPREIPGYPSSMLDEKIAAS